MTNKLKPEQRRRVAEVVTGNQHRIDNDVPGRLVAFVSDYWDPGRKLWQWKALVRWLAENLQYEDDLVTEELIVYIAHDNTEALERMVLEVLEAQDGK